LKCGKNCFSFLKKYINENAVNEQERSDQERTSAKKKKKYPLFYISSFVVVAVVIVAIFGQWHIIYCRRLTLDRVLQFIQNQSEKDNDKGYNVVDVKLDSM
jgi:hypothetical protein